LNKYTINDSFFQYTTGLDGNIAPCKIDVMKIIYILTIIFISALIGTALNELLLLFVPQEWAIYGIMASSIKPLWSIEKLDLIVLWVNFGITFNFNILTLAGIITGCLFSLRKL